MVAKEEKVYRLRKWGYNELNLRNKKRCIALIDGKPKPVEQIKSFSEWMAYFRFLRTVPSKDRQNLLIKVMREIYDNEMLSEDEAQELEREKEELWSL